MSILDKIKVELLTARTGFVLNVSKVGDTLDDTAAQSWEPVTCTATSVKSRRGGNWDGIGIDNEVGSLEVSFTGTGSITADPFFRKGTPMRLLMKPENAPDWVQQFTGTIKDIQTTEFPNGKFRANVYAVDALERLSSTMLYGTVNRSGIGYDTPAERRDKLVNAAAIERAPSNFTADGPQLTGTRFTNVARWGTNNSGETRGTLTTTPYPSGDLYFRALSSGTAGVPLYVEPLRNGLTFTMPNLVIGDRYTVYFALYNAYATGSFTEEFEANQAAFTYSARVGDRPWTDAVTHDNQYVSSGTMSVSFVATATTERVQIARNPRETTRVYLSDPENLYGYVWLHNQGKYWHYLADTDYESTVKNHLDKYAASTGNIWNLLRDGRLYIQEPMKWHEDRHPRVFLCATNATGTYYQHGTAYHVCVNEAELAQSFGDTLNSVSLTNQERAKSDTNASGWEEREETAKATNLLSIIDYGENTASYDTNIYTGKTAAGDHIRRAEGIISTQPSNGIRPKRVVTNLRSWSPQALEALDVGQLFFFVRKGKPVVIVLITQIEISSTASDGSIMITLELAPYKEGFPDA